MAIWSLGSIGCRMGVKIAGILGSIIVLIGCSNPNPAENDPNYKARSGKVIYTERCISCHGNDGKLNSGGAKDLSKSSIGINEISTIIKNGKNGMPRQGNFIYNDEEMLNLVDFVKSLRK